ncbi:helix-turn-helix transcriptional regulator [Aureibacillus halotolerans]|uniref:DNA-binding XRE family transcriptional regulator n=1 Tax=Aureibacillus halotolerans TaxID=1508390 RepID=A0A4R6UHU9_9BACI|nr:helix-turn-helix transcriptional regulator [Aureibacillus halotolerans]TDQ42734.1 DNA-binding XRE family transcriptional regulator [Aureibacillus halotolerans]
MKALANQLKKLRKARAFTQKQLALQLGISESAIGMYERDEREPSLPLLLKLADLYDVSLDELFERSRPLPQEVMEDSTLYETAELNELLKNLQNADAKEIRKLLDLWVILRA